MSSLTYFAAAHLPIGPAPLGLGLVFDADLEDGLKLFIYFKQPLKSSDLSGCPCFQQLFTAFLPLRLHLITQAGRRQKRTGLQKHMLQRPVLLFLC